MFEYQFMGKNAFDLAIIYIPIYVYKISYDSYGMKSNAYPENF